MYTITVGFSPTLYCRETKFSGTQGDRGIFLCSADHEQDWQPYPVDPYSAICDDHTYIHTVDPMLFKYHEEVLYYLQPLIPPKRSDIFSPITGGCSEGLGVF